MDKFLKQAQKDGADYAEITKTSSNNTHIEINNQEVKEISQGETLLYGVRVLSNGSFGVAYSYKDDFKALFELAMKNAKSVPAKEQIKSYPQYSKRIKTEFKKNVLDVSLDEKKNLLMEHAKPKKQIVNLRLIYGDSQIKREFLNTEGTDLTWNDSNCGYFAWAYAKNHKAFENFLKIKRLKGGYEIMKTFPEHVQFAMKKAVELLDAKPAKGGLFDTVIDQPLGGVFAHEAVGHACEADLVNNHLSILVDKIGKKIGNDNVNIVDDGTLKEWGWAPFDSDGVKGMKTQLIQNGVLKNYLHSRDTAALFNKDLTGNGRQLNAGYKIIPRMTNTFIEAGDSNFDEMISEIKEGYYLKDSAGGQVDCAGGEFLFNAMEGFYVKNGEIQHPVKSVSLVGNILEILHKIKLVGKDLKFRAGTCGKSGQWVPVSSASPHMLIEKAKIGGVQ